MGYDSILRSFVLLGSLSSLIALIVVSIFSAVSSAHHRRIEALFARIMSESEERIGNVNAMMRQCTEALQSVSQTQHEVTAMFSSVTSTYAEQIRALQQQRDRLSEENKDLARAVNRLSDILALKKDQVINLNSSGHA